MSLFQKLFAKPQSFSSDPLETVLRKADLLMVRDAIADMHKMANAEAAKEGCACCFKNDYAAAWKSFSDKPTIDNARAFLKAAPMLLQHFELCSPGTDFYMFNRMKKG